jgi:hypothetical protein
MKHAKQGMLPARTDRVVSITHKLPWGLYLAASRERILHPARKKCASKVALRLAIGTLPVINHDNSWTDLQTEIQTRYGL